LKEKRSVLKSLKARLHDRFNISVAATGHHDLWQRAELTACVAARERRHAETVLDSADRIVSSEQRTRTIASDRTFYGTGARRPTLVGRRIAFRPRRPVAIGVV